jgi:uncharacterized protein
MPTHDTPIVFVEDTLPLPPRITDVETAIPAFIGSTQKAASNTSSEANTDLLLKPTLVRSMLDVEEFFGDAGTLVAVYVPAFSVT